MSELRVSLLLALMTVGTVPSAGAAPARCERHVLRGAAGGEWQAPLARAVTVRTDAVPLRGALQRIADAAGLRLSYSADLLPSDRAVCLTYERVPLGAALADLLKDVAVRAVIAGADHIVLTPGATSLRSEAGVTPPLVPLAPVVATATPEPPSHERTGIAFTVIDREMVARYASTAEALSATVPGMWAWPSPAGFTTLYSVRGASSFGVSSPKIYIDGIEVANPLLAAQIPPEHIERIEVIRGPQGGALYGGDAVSGVTNIVTRHETHAAGAPRLQVQSGLAFSESAYAAGSPLGQDHAVALQLGTPARSGTLSLSLGQVGEYLPGASARQMNTAASLRVVGARAIVTGTARFARQSAGNPFGTLASRAWSSQASLDQYTLGARAVLRQNDHVTHAVVIGVDGYALDGLPADSTIPLSPADQALREAGSAALRTTARISSVVGLERARVLTAAMTFAAEHSNLQQQGGDARRYLDATRSSNGLSAQLDATFLDRLSLAAALRLERDEVNGHTRGTSTLPMLAGSYRLIEDQLLDVRLRASYGKAVRWPEISTRTNTLPWRGHGARQLPLAPEQQAGHEAGVDATIGGRFQVQVTRYDQTASGLVQLAADGHGLELQNVGEIENRGWEMQGSLRHGALMLTGALALTESRVERVADGYTGDLRAGDRMLGVPARTVGVSASWLANGWTAALTAYRAFDWINYDRARMAADGATVAGAREYWLRYNGATRVRASFTRDLGRNVSLLITGENLLGSQIGEPDNLTVVPGRTVGVGARLGL